ACGRPAPLHPPAAPTSWTAPEALRYAPRRRQRNAAIREVLLLCLVWRTIRRPWLWLLVYALRPTFRPLPAPATPPARREILTRRIEGQTTWQAPGFPSPRRQINSKTA